MTQGYQKMNINDYANTNGAHFFVLPTNESNLIFSRDNFNSNS